MSARSFELAHAWLKALLACAALAAGCAPEPETHAVAAGRSDALTLQLSAAGGPAIAPNTAEPRASVQSGPIDWICVTIQCNGPGGATCIERCNCPPGMDLTCNIAARVECDTGVSRKVRFCGN